MSDGSRRRQADLEAVYRYHDGTKHYFNRFARSLGYLDWASQPRPFRSYIGSRQRPLERRLVPIGISPPDAVAYDDLFVPGRIRQAPVTIAAIGDMLRHALGLSAWKVFGSSRWALRANPSSGNLHPTEAYIVVGPLPEVSSACSVWHYAPESHSIEQRCRFGPDAWPFGNQEDGDFLVALTSIHWRESWKYGERGFRYCQHDLGHAIGALSMAAAIYGWQLAIQPHCAHASLASLVGIDRADDYIEAEREEAGCLMRVGPGRPSDDGWCARLADAARGGQWSGGASQLSEDHVQWTFIDEVAAATRDPGATAGLPESPPLLTLDQGGVDLRDQAPSPDARQLMLQRRSAVALDGRSTIERQRFFGMLARLVPQQDLPRTDGPVAFREPEESLLVTRPTPPWSALWWTPRIHLAIFVHRVTGLDQGLYLLLRDRNARARLHSACNPTFEWLAVDDGLPLYRLAKGPFGAHSQRLSCDQAIAADGFFSLAMIADFDRSIREHGPSFYRNLFWEAGAIGQVLYLEAEAAGVRGTGIGCFYDDAVHDTLGLQDHAFQSLYHFTVGSPVEDRRLTTEAGYDWER